MTATPATTTAPAATTAPRRRRGGSLLRRFLMAVGLPIILLAIWWVASAGSESFFFPPLQEILATFPTTWFEGRITAEVLPSLYRLVIGYLIALVLGVGVGTAIGLSPRLRAFAEPALEFFRAIPPPVMIPIIMLFLGIFTTMKVFVIATGAVWPILLNTVEGVRGVDDVLRDTSSVYRLRPATKLRTLVLRGASPQIVTGARQALSIAIILMVISEMFAASNGLGFTIVQFQRSFAIPEMWTGIILLGLVGVILSLIFRAIERPVLAWYTGLRQSQRGGN
ncbi:ABC transporter permease [Georgenia thermotolerans]|uniref:ABC transporter permease subunit n=1 Tax=Georgenia thermotolerans TaxID=527326 RepID=A0A7J5UJU8_9MICO|nr:ABC transporter permease [Georgenia thermotolerans]KAE8762627.1 ABC transporter permease subunit [Georgenia thermotolerans]